MNLVTSTFLLPILHFFPSGSSFPPVRNLAMVQNLNRIPRQQPNFRFYSFAINSVSHNGNRGSQWWYIKQPSPWDWEPDSSPAHRSWRSFIKCHFLKWGWLVGEGTSPSSRTSSGRGNCSFGSWCHDPAPDKPRIVILTSGKDVLVGKRVERWLLRKAAETWSDRSFNSSSCQ